MNAATQQKANPKMLSKISYKTVCGKVNRRALPEDGSSLLVMRVIGQAHKTTTGNGDNGTWTAFLGRFEATNVETGEMFASGKLFLPSSVTPLLESAIIQANGAVDFGFDIGIQEDDTTAVGYKYTVESLLQPAENDPIALLKAQMNAPALPAPKVAPQTALLLETAPEQNTTEKPSPDNTENQDGKPHGKKK